MKKKKNPIIKYLIEQCTTKNNFKMKRRKRMIEAVGFCNTTFRKPKVKAFGNEKNFKCLLFVSFLISL